MKLWRLSRYESLSGEGGLRRSARWHTAGFPVVYLADHPGSALLEVFVHLEVEAEEIPLDYKYLQIAAPENLVIPNLHTPTDDSWKDNLTLTRHLGDTWLASRASALARVPSAILPATCNCLLNPLHPDAASLQIVASHKTTFDRRLLRK
jgi:RES domain-containing protein